MSTPLNIQEDNFDDVEDLCSEGALSDGNSDFSYKEDESFDQAEGMANDVAGPDEAVARGDIFQGRTDLLLDTEKPRLSVIPEEPAILTDDMETTNKDVWSGFETTLADGTANFSDSPTKLSVDIKSDEFVGGSDALRRLQRDQESFLTHPQFVTFAAPAQNKENSWEPSIHTSPPPVVRPNVKALAARNDETSSFLDVSDRPSPPRPSAVVQKSVEKTPVRSPRGSLFDSVFPKMSTPNSLACSSRQSPAEDLSLAFNGMSAIFSPRKEAPEKQSRGTRVEDCKVKFATAFEKDLSKSFFDQIAKKDLDDSELLSVLLNAKQLRRPPLSFHAQASGTLDDHGLRPKATDTSTVCTSKALIRQPTKLIAQPSSGDAASASENTKAKAASSGTLRGELFEDFLKKRLTQPKGKPVELHADLSDGKTQSTGKSPLCVSLRTSSGDAEARKGGGVASAASSSLTSARPTSAQCGSEADGKLLSFRPPVLNLGFVPQGMNVNGVVTLRNISSKKLNLSVSLHSGKGFKLRDAGIVSLGVEQTYEVHLTFTPTLCAFYSDSLGVTVLNAEHVKYRVPLEGSGGVASLVVKQRENVSMLRDGSMLVTTGGRTEVTFVVENKGMRDAFLRVLPRDKHRDRLMDGVTVQPSDRTVIMRRESKQFTVVWDRSMVSSSQSSNARLATAPSQLSSSSAYSPQFYIQLRWGQEALRRRLKRLEVLNGAHYRFGDLSYTDAKYLDEEKSAAKTKLTAAEQREPSIFDYDAFELGLRVIDVSVVDNRLTTSSSSLATSEALYQSVVLPPDADATLVTGEPSVLQDVTVLAPGSIYSRK